VLKFGQIIFLTFFCCLSFSAKPFSAWELYNFNIQWNKKDIYDSTQNPRDFNYQGHSFYDLYYPHHCEPLKKGMVYYHASIHNLNDFDIEIKPDPLPFEFEITQTTWEMRCTKSACEKTPLNKISQKNVTLKFNPVPTIIVRIFLYDAVKKTYEIELQPKNKFFRIAANATVLIFWETTGYHLFEEEHIVLPVGEVPENSASLLHPWIHELDSNNPLHLYDFATTYWKGSKLYENDYAFSFALNHPQSLSGILVSAGNPHLKAKSISFSIQAKNRFLKEFIHGIEENPLRTAKN